MAHNHMEACLDELRRLVGSSDYSDDLEVGPARKPDRHGYVGYQYYGTGLPLYTVEYQRTWVDQYGEPHWKTMFYDVRATSRAELRQRLKEMFPKARVSR